VPEALAETTQLLEAVRGNPAAEPFVLGGHAYLLAQADELDAARAALARMRNIANRLGQRIVLWASWGQNVGRTELLAGDPERAERALRPCYQALRRAGDRGFSSTIAGQLAHALTELDRPEEAAAFAAEAREAAGAADVLSQLLWRSALAKAVAAQGEHGEAGRLSAEAVALAETTEWPNVLGDALLDQARVLRLAGRETAEPLARADVVYVAKRNAAGHRRASALGARTPTTEGAT
jgi:tetratricopeptide (TPR) repeat protein